MASSRRSPSCETDSRLNAGKDLATALHALETSEAMLARWRGWGPVQGRGHRLPHRHPGGTDHRDLTIRDQRCSSGPKSEPECTSPERAPSTGPPAVVPDNLSRRAPRPYPITALISTRIPKNPT